MSNTIISPNMGLPVPVPGTDPGPDWANNIVADMSIIDSHSHSPGQGVPITPAGMNINSDLTFNNANASDLRSVRFFPQGSPLAVATDIGCLYESGVDLYYNDGSGNQVRITQSGSVTGASGTITGLPSGTASASYSAGTFTFQGATSTPATMNIGPIITGAASANSKNVTISASGSLAANYAMTLPLALPSLTSSLLVDSSGNMSFGANANGTFSPTVSWTHAVTVNSSAFYYTRNNNIVNANGFIDVTMGVSSTNFSSITLPVSTGTLAISGTIGSQISASGSSTFIQLAASGTTLAIPYGSGSIGFGAGVTGRFVFNFTYQVV